MIHLQMYKDGPVRSEKPFYLAFKLLFPKGFLYYRDGELRRHGPTWFATEKEAEKEAGLAGFLINKDVIDLMKKEND